MNGDSIPDVLVGAWANGIDRRILCISGASRGSSPIILWSYDTHGDVYTVAQISDVNGNGIDDALASSWSDTVFCFEGSNGTPIWKYNIGTIGMRIEPIDDINGDSIQDVIVGSWLSSIIMVSGSDGTRIWSTPTNGDVWTVYPMGDVNYDGLPDVVAGSGGGNIYCCDGRTGTVIWEYPAGGWINTVRSIPDVNGDGISEAVGGNQLSTPPSYAYCLEGDTIVTGIQENLEFGIRNAELLIYPNPFKSRVVIRIPLSVKFNLSRFSGTIGIYDINGGLVKSFSAVGGKLIAESGITWDGKDDKGMTVPSGLYFLRLMLQDKYYTNRVILLR